MFKTKLQELCHKKLLGRPQYSCIRDGPDHDPLFRASVVVDGASFVSTDVSKTYKEALNEAAKFAFFRITIGDKSSADAEVPGNSDVKVGTKYLRHKQQLNEYAQSRTLYPPLYTNKREGPPHAPHFQATVTIDGKSFKSPGYYKTLKEAEHAAANAALQSLLMDEFQEIDTCCHSTLLQELTQKNEFAFLPYNTVRHADENVGVEPGAEVPRTSDVNVGELAGDVDITSSGSSSKEPTKASPCLGSLTDPNTQKISQSASSVNSSPGEGSVGYATESEEGQSSAPTVALPSLASLSITSPEKNKNMKTGNYLLCNKVRVYTSIPDTIPEGTVLLPIADNKWVAVCLDFANQKHH